MVIHPSYYDACDVIYYVIVVRARRMVRIFFFYHISVTVQNRTNVHMNFFD